MRRQLIPAYSISALAFLIPLQAPRPSYPTAANNAPTFADVPFTAFKLALSSRSTKAFCRNGRAPHVPSMIPVIDANKNTGCNANSQTAHICCCYATLGNSTNSDWKMPRSKKANPFPTVRCHIHRCKTLLYCNGARYCLTVLNPGSVRSDLLSHSCMTSAMSTQVQTQIRLENEPSLDANLAPSRVFARSSRSVAFVLLQSRFPCDSVCLLSTNLAL